MYLAHSKNTEGKEQPLSDHLRQVAQLAASFADSFGAAEEAYLAGMLHDLGKYGDLFQLRLQQKEHGIDHWSLGAWLGVKECKNIAVALATYGHHIGLQSLYGLCDLDPVKLSNKHPLGLKLSALDADVLIERLDGDGLELSIPSSSFYGPSPRDTASAMLDVRMLYSALVDADFLDTEAHFNPHLKFKKIKQNEITQLDAKKSLEILLDHISKLEDEANASQSIKQIRSDLLKACLSAAESPVGIWTLSAPTGAGKTLAMLAFALRHAATRNLQRIIMVIPFLSIIEQTARVYRDILCPHFGAAYVLEHHSLTGTGVEEKTKSNDDLDGDNDFYRLRQAATENWDAPIIVTTSVQMLESLFSNRSSACRKLHRLARSVILFDEVQTLPDHLAVATLSTLSHLAERYGTSVVFSTATQPAFTYLHEHVRTLGDSGWQPKEIVPSGLRLFNRARRTKVSWPALGQPTPWGEIAAEIKELPQVLCIVNVKAHARDLFKLLSEQVEDGCFHLSTAMCPAHRQHILDAVRAHLAEGRPCRLISTQCVEAGVDVDFPVVYRALGPLESIAQAAGRCNRNDLLSDIGQVKVFVPQDDAMPSGSYKQASSVTRMLLKERGPDGLDLDCPELFEEYYKQLYNLTRPEVKRPELLKAIKLQDFAEVTKLYRVIEHDAINVLVPYRKDAFEELAAQARDKGLTAAWIRAARAHTVGVYRPKDTDPIWTWLEPVPIGRWSRLDDWFILTDEKSYDPQLGLLPPDSPAVWTI